MHYWFDRHVNKVQRILDEPFGRQNRRTWRAVWEQDGGDGPEMVAARIVRKDTGEPLAIHVHLLHINAIGGETFGEVSAAEIVAFLGLAGIDPAEVHWDETSYKGELYTQHGPTDLIPAGPANGPVESPRRH